MAAEGTEGAAEAPATGLGKVVHWLTVEKFMGYELWRYVCLFGSILAGLVVGRIVRFLLERAARRLTEKRGAGVLPTMLACLGRPATLLFFTLGLQIGIDFMNIQTGIAGTADLVVRVLYALTVAYAVYRLVDVVDHYFSRWAERTDNKIDDMLVPLVRKSLRIAIVVVLALFVAEQVYGKPLTTLLATLGVGGLAIALAAQDTIKNFFGSLMILLDKPFQVGDRVVVGEFDGPVEEVGFRSTKIRTLDGHVVTVPNDQIANEKVKNISKRPYIRRVANITITYDTPAEKVRRAVEIIQEVLDNHEGMDPEFPPRVYFNDFNDWALNILAIYWYHPPEYWDYLAFTQKVNLEIFERFNAEGIEFAFPTQTVFHANDDKRQLAVRLLNGQADVKG